MRHVRARRMGSEFEEMGREFEQMGREFEQMGHEIAQEVRESVRASLAGVRERREHERHRIMIKTHRHRHDDEDVSEMREEPIVEESRGPAAGSPERQAILDAIARGELNVDDAIKKLRGEA